MEKAMAGELRWVRAWRTISANVETPRDVIRRLKQIFGEQNSPRASSGCERTSRANL
jgi:hypothetical protein